MVRKLHPFRPAPSFLAPTKPQTPTRLTNVSARDRTTIHNCSSWRRRTRRENCKQKYVKTYNTRDSLLVTDATTNPAVTCLYMGERTGSLVVRCMWSYVLASQDSGVYIQGFVVAAMMACNRRLTYNVITQLRRSDISAKTPKCVRDLRSHAYIYIYIYTT